MPKIAVACTNCGTTLHRWPFQVRENVTGTYFCSSECDGAHKRVGEITKRGYRRSKAGGKRLFEHRRVVQEAIGRELLANEVVHHDDRDKLHNDLSNLVVTSQSEHMREHRPLSFCIETAERRIVAGDPLKDIAQSLGVSVHVIESALARRGKTVNGLRGLPAFARVAWDLGQITQMAKEGATVESIAQSCGASPASVKRFVKRATGGTVTDLRG